MSAAFDAFAASAMSDLGSEMERPRFGAARRCGGSKKDIRVGSGVAAADEEREFGCTTGRMLLELVAYCEGRDGVDRGSADYAKLVTHL